MSSLEKGRRFPLKRERERERWVVEFAQELGVQVDARQSWDAWQELGSHWGWGGVEMPQILG